MRRAKVLLWTLICCGLAAPGPSAAQPPPAINLRLPSDAAGGGTLAIRLTIPPQSVGARYADGAPVLVFVPGGQSVGGLNGGESYAMEGFIAVTMIFPGGTSGGFHSDGVYDYRGQRCIDALRDVLLFAGGRKADSIGRTIDQAVPVHPLTEMVGMIGSSNGGPISMATLAAHGSQLGFVSTYVGWENPTNDQTVLVEAGGRFYDCDPASDGDGNGIPTDDGKNPYFTAYASSTLEMEWDRLSYDPAYSWVVNDPAGQHPPVARQGALFYDGNGNGVIDAVAGDPDCFDVDGSGSLDYGEDYLLRPTPSYESGALLLHYSVGATAEAETRGLFGPVWPPDVAASSACDLFWSMRDATRRYAALAAARPDLRCTLAFAAADHVQASDPHPHVQQAYDGLRAGGIWCRLNPDESYFRLIDGSPAAPPADNDANLTANWPGLTQHDEDYPLASSVASLAAVLEMADRAHAGVWIPNLSGPVTSAADVGAASSLSIEACPHPAQRGSLLRWRGMGEGPARIRLFDVAGRVCGERRLEAIAPEGAITLAAIPDRSFLWRTGVYWAEISSPGGATACRIVFLGR
ncbi:MAG: hypothetical protein FJY88_05965 [Candidatus Eisenbacteria bacterium]|nr:hypothetical protein [Candidatus Eisenbacteria bacterium]